MSTLRFRVVEKAFQAKPFEVPALRIFWKICIQSGKDV